MGGPRLPVFTSLSEQWELTPFAGVLRQVCVCVCVWVCVGVCGRLFRHSNRGLITKGTIGSPVGKRPPFAKRVQNI